MATKKQYNRHRQKNPKSFVKTSFRTVPLSHTKYRGKKKGKAVVGKLKKTRKWTIQSILEKIKRSKK